MNKPDSKIDVPLTAVFTAPEMLLGDEELGLQAGCAAGCRLKTLHGTWRSKLNNQLSQCNMMKISQKIMLCFQKGAGGDPERP